jgi:hypothetical protein
MAGARETEIENQARAQAIEKLLAYDFSQLSDIVAQRESDLAQRLSASLANWVVIHGRVGGLSHFKHTKRPWAART